MALVFSLALTSSCHAPTPVPLVSRNIDVAPPPVGTFAPPKPERLALVRADALLAQSTVVPSDADAVIDALDQARGQRPPLTYDCECAAAQLLQKSARPLAAASRWQRAARAAPLVEHAARAERMASLLAGAAGHRTRLVHVNERWPLRLMALPQWGTLTVLWAEAAPDDDDTARALALVSLLAPEPERLLARSLQQRRPIGLSRLRDEDRAMLVAIALKTGGPTVAKEALPLARQGSTHPDALEWTRLGAEIASRERRYEDALEAFRVIVARGTPFEQARALGRMGQIFEAQERFHEGALAFRRAAVLAPTEAEREEWLFATGVLHVWAGEMAQALGAFERYRNAHTNERHLTSVLWFSAWASLRLFDTHHALSLLVELANSGDATLVPQAEYWLGRLFATLGQETPSTVWFRKAASHARSYYALLALGRLPSLAARSQPQAAVDAVGVAALAWKSPLGQRLQALEELGLLPRALSDVGSLPAAPGASAAMASLCRAELFLRQGDMASASRHSDEALRLSRERPLPPAWAARAEYLAYPRAEADAVLHAAQGRDVSPLLLWAVMRQESLFAYDAVSTSGALGLMQLLPKTANRIAERLQEPAPSRPQLLQPARNIGYGAWYLGGLLEDTKGSVPLAVASYNAGPEARDRWLAQMSSQQLDVVVESIPKGETRRYTKIVLQNLGTYARLYEGAQLRIDTKIPSVIAHDIDF